MVEVIAAGHICVDLIPQFTTDAGDNLSAYLTPGRLSEVGPMPLATGGSVSNTGLALKRLGVDTRLMGKVSDDLLGRAILEIVSSYGPELAEAMIVVPGETSSYTVVISPPHIDRMFLHCPGANHTFGADDVRYDLVAEARIFHFGYPPYLGRMYADGGREMIDMLRRSQEVGAPTTLDMAMPDPAGPSGQVNWQAILRATLPYVDLFMPSAEEWLFMADRRRFEELTASAGPAGMLAALRVDEIRALGSQALDMGAKFVVLKLGVRV
ncbi:MAG: carbohydrate kinase family protein, partial [Anaerolineae bacterium]